ncbi:MAG: thioesterase family protein [Planctomycetota bacterium]|nr:thioesterase family protein [Planctomycetota bacterium]
MHVFETKIRLQHTDGAGVVFFARYFQLAHLAYEDLLDAIGQSFPADLATCPVLYPIVHAESDYRAMLRLGDDLRIEVLVAAVKSRSFTLTYRFVNPAGDEAAVLQTVHVAVDKATGRSTQLPEELAAALRGL